MTLLEQIKDAIRDHYILVERVDTVITKFEAQSAHLDMTKDPHRLAHDLTFLLQDITNDKHFAVSYRPAINEETTDRPVAFAPNFARNNNFFYEAKRLAGNIGYLDFRLFPDHQEAMETAIGAMALLANTDALIYDVRLNRGGSPAMIQLLLSYLFAEPTHLITFENRTENTTWQTWTLPYVPGKKYLDKPVYVLVSQMTGSAAEEFSYDLQQLERGVLVGQTTAGAGHIVTAVRLSEGFTLNVSNGRPISPISKKGWEAEGVHPHIETAIGDELCTAHRHAIDALLDQAKTDDVRKFLEWEKLVANAGYTPYIPQNPAQYTGKYENIVIASEGDKLLYQSSRYTLPLTPLDEHLFEVMDGMRVSFGEDGMLTEWRDMDRKVLLEKTAS